MVVVINGDRNALLNAEFINKKWPSSFNFVLNLNSDVFQIMWLVLVQKRLILFYFWNFILVEILITFKNFQNELKQ